MKIDENTTPLLTVDHLKQYFKVSGSFTVKAVEDVSFKIYPGETYGLVGESGSGKSTIGRSIIRLYDPTAGEIRFNGLDISGKMSKADSQTLRTQMQMIFQDPMASLNPRKKVEDIIGEGLDIHHKCKNKEERDEMVKAILAKVGLAPEHATRYPHQFSGGQRQRVAFARALAPNPQLLLLDEPFAAIDAKIRQELRTWLKDMIEKLGITSIFVTHDQDEAIEVADEIIITNRGHIEQKGSPVEVYQSPETAFSASFFGQAATVRDYHVFNYFEDIPGAEYAIVRPEFVKVTRKNEVQKYKSSASEADVERVAFRGSYFELQLKLGEVVLSARRGLDEPLVRQGEKVDVFVQRLFVIKENKVYALENSSAREDYLVI